MNFLRGLHYRSAFLYNLQNLLKLGTDYRLRFRLAAAGVRAGESVLDLCSGVGSLKDHLPQDCGYQCVEASPEFIEILRQKRIPVTRLNLHDGFCPADLKVDVAVMIVALAQFRDTTVNEILENLKKAASRVVIVEDVLTKPRAKNSFVGRLMNFMCATDYYRPIELFTGEEFKSLMRRHGYGVRRHDRRYVIGFWPAATEAFLNKGREIS